LNEFDGGVTIHGLKIVSRFSDDVLIGLCKGNSTGKAMVFAMANRVGFRLQFPMKTQSIEMMILP